METYKSYKDIPVDHLEPEMIEVPNILSTILNGKYDNIYDPSDYSIDIIGLNEFFKNNPTFNSRKILINIDQESYYGNSYFDGIIIIENRLETDKEFSDRVTNYQKTMFKKQQQKFKEKLVKKFKIEKELKELTRLKEKYEKELT